MTSSSKKLGVSILGVSALVALVLGGFLLLRRLDPAQRLLGSWVRQGGDIVFRFAADGTVRVLDDEHEIHFGYRVDGSKILIQGLSDGAGQIPGPLLFSFDEQGRLLLGEGEEAAVFKRINNGKAP